MLQCSRVEALRLGPICSCSFNVCTLPHPGNSTFTPEGNSSSARVAGTGAWCGPGCVLHSGPGTPARAPDLSQSADPAGTSNGCFSTFRVSVRSESPPWQWQAFTLLRRVLARGSGVVVWCGPVCVLGRLQEVGQSPK